MEKVDAFKTRDGQVFLTKLAATRHEAELALLSLVHAWLRDQRDEGRDQIEWTLSDKEVVRFLLDDTHQLVVLLGRLRDAHVDPA